MKKIIIGIIIGIILTLGAVMVFAEEPTVAVDLSGSSAYVWRGQMFDDEPVVNPSVSLGLAGFSLEYWQNINTRHGEVDEYDMTLGYEYAWGIATFNLGVIAYDYPNSDAPSTQEGVFGLKVAGPVDVFANAYYDFNEVNAFYGELGVGRSFELAQTLSLDCAVKVGASDSAYNEYWFGLTGSSPQDASAGLALPWAVTDKFTITPAVQYSYMLDDTIRDTVEDDDTWVGTLSLSYEF